MKCGECRLASRVSAQFMRVSTGELAGNPLIFCICPLDEDDMYAEDAECIDEKSYKELLKKEEAEGDGRLSHYQV